MNQYQTLSLTGEKYLCIGFLYFIKIIFYIYFQEPPQKRRRILYDRTNLQRAYEATLCGMPAYRAAKVYSVPPTTLRNRISWRVASDARVGHETIFTSEEEDKLYEHIIYMAQI